MMAGAKMNSNDKSSKRKRENQDVMSDKKFKQLYRETMKRLKKTVQQKQEIQQTENDNFNKVITNLWRLSNKDKIYYEELYKVLSSYS